MSDIKISIVIPVYNMAEYLDETIGTWTAQKMREIEIIYINDASTDASLEILERWSRKDPRIKIIDLPRNSGPFTARIEGVNHAIGKYIMFADADDTISVGACEELYFLVKKYKVDILHFNTRVINVNHKQGRSIRSIKSFVKPYRGRLEKKDVLKGCFAEGKYQFSLWNKIYRSKVCKKAFSYMEKEYLCMAEDKLAYFLIAFFAKSYLGLNTKARYNYYYGRGGFGKNKISKERFERFCSGIRAADRAAQFLDSQDLLEQYKNIEYRFRRDVVVNCLWKYIWEVPEAEKYDCFYLMKRYFDTNQKDNSEDVVYSAGKTVVQETVGKGTVYKQELRDALQEWGYSDVAEDYWIWYCWTLLLSNGTDSEGADEALTYIKRSYRESSFFDGPRKVMYWVLKCNPRLFDSICVLLGRRKRAKGIL